MENYYELAEVFPQERRRKVDCDYHQVESLPYRDGEYECPVRNEDENLAEGIHPKVC